MMIKATEIYGESKFTVLLNPDHIVTIKHAVLRGGVSGSLITLSTGTVLSVVETVDKLYLRINGEQ